MVSKYVFVIKTVEKEDSITTVYIYANTFCYDYFSGSMVLDILACVRANQKCDRNGWILRFNNNIKLFYCGGFIACENSRPSSLPARLAFRENATWARSEEGWLFSQASGFINGFTVMKAR